MHCSAHPPVAARSTPNDMAACMSATPCQLGPRIKILPQSTVTLCSSVACTRRESRRRHAAPSHSRRLTVVVCTCSCLALLLVRCNHFYAPVPLVTYRCRTVLLATAAAHPTTPSRQAMSEQGHRAIGLPFEAASLRQATLHSASHAKSPRPAVS
jgi:hypothetical protein